MINNQAKSTDKIGASVISGGVVDGKAKGGGVFHFQCFDKNGNLKWEDKAYNLVVNEGLKDMNDKYFSGVSYSATWYLGLITGPGPSTIAAADTLASKAWTEDTNYIGNRKAVTFGAATLADPSVISNSGSPSQFNINGTTTIAGAFLASVDTGTAGILFSASDFQAPGDRSVVANDIINVTYQFSLDAA